MIQGICLCGEIEFEAEELPGMTFNCHCSRCRKSHGAAFATQVLLDKSSLKFKKGREELSEYHAPSIVRSFCSKCGSRLLNYGEDGSKYMSVAVAAIKDRSDFKPIGECFVGEKLSFVELNESIAHYNELPQPL
jgi:hypothetical protein